MAAMFLFSPRLFASFIQVNVTGISALSPGFNNFVSKALVVIFPSSVRVHSGLSSATNFNPSGI